MLFSSTVPLLIDSAPPPEKMPLNRAVPPGVVTPLMMPPPAFRLKLRAELKELTPGATVSDAE